MAVGSVRIDLEASTAKFERQMQSFSKKLDKQIGNITRGLKTIGISATAAAAGLGVLVKSTINTNDQLAKTADKIGTTTEELSKLRFAAELTGVSSNTLDMALQRMTRRLSEASNGTGEAVGALEELNINAQEISQLPLSEQVNLIATRMDALGSQADRVRIAMKLFDSEGVALVNTLRGGGTALDEYRKKAEKLGIVVDTKTAKASEAFNDKLTELSAQATGFGRQLAAELLPVLNRVIDDFKEFAQSRSFTETLRAIRVVVEASIVVFKSLILAVQGLGIVLNSLAGNTELADEQAKDFLKSLEKVRKELQNIGGTTAEASVSFKIKEEKQEETKQEVDKFKDFKKQIKDFYKEITDYNTQFADAFKNAFRGLEDALVQFTQTGKLNFKDLANSIIADISRIAIRQAVIAPLVGAATSAFGSFFAPSTISGGLNSTGSVGASSSLTSISQFARGGRPEVGNVSLVGENGPELFVPDTAGRVIPNGKLSGLMSGGNANGQTNMADVQITINAIDTQSGVSFLLANQDTIEGIINKSLSTNGTTRELI